MSDIRVFIADDQKTLLDSLMQGLNAEPGISVVGTAINAEQLLNRLFPGRADALLLDIFSKDVEFLELITTLTNRDPNLRVIILSGNPDYHFAQETRNAGAVFYTSKNLGTSELATLIKNVVREGLTGIQFYDSGTQKKDIGANVKEELTKRELEVLKELCKGARNDQEIAEALSIGSEATVAAHRRNLKRTFKDNGITNATGIGYWAAKWDFFPDIDLPQ